MQKNDNNRPNDIFSWLVAVACLIFIPPLGLLLLFLKLKNVYRSEQGSFRPDAWSRGQGPEVYPDSEGSRAESRAEAGDERAGKRNRSGSRAENASRGARKKRGTGGGFLRFGGWALLAGGLISLVSRLGGTPLPTLAAWDLAQGLALCAGGLAVLAVAYFKRKKELLYQKYHTIIGPGRAVPVDSVAACIPASFKRACADLQAMIDRGYFGDTAFLDMSCGYLFLSPEDRPAPAPREAAREEEKPQEAQEPTADGEARSEYERLLNGIRRLRTQIRDLELSAKIGRIEEIASGIFATVERKPEKQPQIRTFMNYYLPTTLKLLDSYARFEAQGVEGENLSAAKKSIKSIMDTLVSGYERQLDALFSEDVLDVSSEIDVLETMMDRDGLTGGSAFQ